MTQKLKPCPSSKSFGLIYKVKNIINGKEYVGKTTKSLSVRWRKHCKTNRPSYLTNAIAKYGKENFTVRIIDTANSKEELDAKERYWIAKSHSIRPFGYNLSSGGVWSGYNFTSADREKAAEINGKKVMCLETKEIFNNIAQACRRKGIKSSSQIIKVCKGKGRLSAGYHWRYVI